MKVEINDAAVVAATRIDSVRLLSIMSISLDKRFIMRPRGVVSKNEIGARRTRCIARRSMRLLASVPKIVRVSEKMKRSNACATPKAAYTPT